MYYKTKGLVCLSTALPVADVPQRLCPTNWPLQDSIVSLGRVAKWLNAIFVEANDTVRYQNDILLKAIHLDKA
jgi:hypothetical protein